MTGRKIFPMVFVYILVVSIILGVAYIGSEVTSVLAERVPLSRSHTIVIDAGHGGEDGGAVSCTGRFESAYNLEIALKLRDLFQLLGYRTGMIRTEDESIYKEGSTIAARKVSDLKERVRIVNETERAILLSIHQNTFLTAGIEVLRYFTGQREIANALQRGCSGPSVKQSIQAATGRSRKLTGFT